MIRQALVALLCLATGCSDHDRGKASPLSPATPDMPQAVVDTPHYRIHSAATAAQTREVAAAVEALHVAYAKTFAVDPAAARLELVLYRDRAQFKANNRSSPWAEAYYREPRSHAYPGSGNNPHHWMLHEATHQLLRQASGFRLRKWANEGVASYFGAATLHKGMLQPGSPDRDAYPIWWLASMRLSGDLQADIDRGDIIPLAQIVEDAGPPVAENVNAYYIHCWSLAHYLLEGDGGRHRDAFLGILQRGGDPVDFQRVIGPYRQVQRGWYEHLRALVEQQQVRAVRIGG